jgi:hypothetical protein
MFSKVEFQRGLRDTPWLRLKDPAKRGIVDIAVDGACSIKLRVVEGVEGLKPKLQRPRLFDPSDFAQSHVIVVDSGP